MQSMQCQYKCKEYVLPDIKSPGNDVNRLYRTSKPFMQPASAGHPPRACRKAAGPALQLNACSCWKAVWVWCCPDDDSSASQFKPLLLLSAKEETPDHIYSLYSGLTKGCIWAM
jgi:hypothetical protein